MADTKLTFEHANSGDVKDDIAMMGVYLYQQFSRRFAEADAPNAHIASVLKEFLCSAHRAEPGSTDSLSAIARDAAAWVEQDREFILKHKLNGWEQYQ